MKTKWDLLKHWQVTKFNLSMKSCLNVSLVVFILLVTVHRTLAESSHTTAGYILNDLPGGHQELKNLKALHKKFLDLQKKKASDKEWTQFTQKANKEIAPMIKDLEHVASSEHKHLQHMLWAIRDYFGPMLKNARTKSNRDQEKFEVHLEEAERIIRKNVI